jgi:hypothetical protein
MNNLIIGNTSQLSYYFPDDYIKISSRDIDYNYIFSKKWNTIFICFGESRKFIGDINLHDDINFYLTMEIINKVKDISNRIVIYSTCELWNQYDGQIDLSLDFNFYTSSYTQSKYKLSKYILNNNYENVFIMYPFNFNSTYRSTEFLFGKIFYSIINKSKIEIGDTYFYRDIIHPKHVVEESINSKGHKIIGSGRLTFVNDFIRDLYKNFNLKFEDYVTEEFDNYSEYSKRNEYYLKSKVCEYTYQSLLKDTINDIKEKIKNKK